MKLFTKKTLQKQQQDPDPHCKKLLDPDRQKMNADPQPCIELCIFAYASSVKFPKVYKTIPDKKKFICSLSHNTVTTALYCTLNSVHSTYIPKVKQIKADSNYISHHQTQSHDRKVHFVLPYS